jgi:hypothetical protein
VNSVNGEEDIWKQRNKGQNVSVEEKGRYKEKKDEMRVGDTLPLYLRAVTSCHTNS